MYITHGYQVRWQEEQIPNKNTKMKSFKIPYNIFLKFKNITY